MFKPRINVSKRTKQLKDAETVILKSDGTEDGTVHTTAGELTMQGADNDALTQNLLKARRGAAIARIGKTVTEGAAQFFEVTILSIMEKIAPLTLQACMTGDVRIMDAWLEHEGISMKLDGLTAVVDRQGSVLATVTFDVPPALKSEVEAFISSTQAIFKAGETGKGIAP